MSKVKTHPIYIWFSQDPTCDHQCVAEIHLADLLGSDSRGITPSVSLSIFHFSWSNHNPILAAQIPLSCYSLNPPFQTHINQQIPKK